MWHEGQMVNSGMWGWMCQERLGSGTSRGHLVGTWLDIDRIGVRGLGDSGSCVNRLANRAIGAVLGSLWDFRASIAT